MALLEKEAIRFAREVARRLRARLGGRHRRVRCTPLLACGRGTTTSGSPTRSRPTATTGTSSGLLVDHKQYIAPARREVA